MSIKRIIECFVCEKQETEKEYGSGWKGWGALQGKEGPEGQLEMSLCPEHNTLMHDYGDKLKEQYNGMD